jgi:hypothetical protein
MYDQNPDKRDLFVNMTTVLLAFVPVGLPTDALSRSAEVSGHPPRVPKRSKG